MNRERREITNTRYVGINLGKRSYELAILRKSGKLWTSEGYLNAIGRQFLYRKLQKKDMVALKAGGLAFSMAKEINDSVGCQVYVINPDYLPPDPASLEENGSYEALRLARMLEEPKEEWLLSSMLPDEEEILQRKLKKSHQRIRQDRNLALTKLHELFVVSGVIKIRKNDLVTAEQRQAALEWLEGFEREEALQLLDFLKIYEQRIVDLEKRLEAEDKP